MKTIGVDLGQKKAAFSVWENDVLIETHAYESTAVNQAFQLRDVASWVHDAVDKINPDYLFIEEPLVGNNVKYSLNIAKMYGAVLADLAWLDDGHHITKVIPVNVTQWKKATVGKGNATKKDVEVWLFGLDRLYSLICGGDQDRIDAAAIGYYGYVIATRATGLTLIPDAG